MTSSLVIVDPIFRGSRLYFSALAARAARSLNLRVIAISRTQARTAHFDELFSGLDVELHEIARMPDSFWYGRIPDDEQRRLLHAVQQMADESAQLYFPGLNEIWPTMPSLLQQCPAGQLPAAAVEYHPDFLLSPWDSLWAPSLRGRWRQLQRYRNRRKALLAGYKPWLQKCPRTRLLVLDERINEAKLARVPRDLRAQIQYLCDPAPARPTGTAKGEPRNDGYTRLLLVGSQSSRKGLHDVVRLCNRFPIASTPIRFRLVGRLTEETEDLRPQLHKHRQVIEWVEDYVSEAQLAEEFEAAHFVMLPYSRDFTGSSGVLASAAAHMRPVIATDHGLIGYRVRTHGIGVTYPSGDIETMWNCLRSLPSTSGRSSSYEIWRNNLNRYRFDISESVHVDHLVNLFRTNL